MMAVAAHDNNNGRARMGRTNFSALLCLPRAATAIVASYLCHHYDICTSCLRFNHRDKPLSETAVTGMVKLLEHVQAQTQESANQHLRAAPAACLSFVSCAMEARNEW